MRTLALLSTTIASVIIATGCGRKPQGPDYMGALTLIAEGKVDVRSQTETDWRKAGLGELILAGDEIRVTDDGFAQLELRDGIVVMRFGENTWAVLQKETKREDAIRYDLRLEEGFIRLQNFQKSTEGVIHVHTAATHTKARFCDFLIEHNPDAGAPPVPLVPVVAPVVPATKSGTDSAANDAHAPDTNGNGHKPEDETDNEAPPADPEADQPKLLGVNDVPPAEPDASTKPALAEEESSTPATQDETPKEETPADVDLTPAPADGVPLSELSETEKTEAELPVAEDPLEPMISGQTTVTAFYGSVFVHALAKPDHPWIGPMDGTAVVVDPAGFDPGGIAQLTTNELGDRHARSRTYTVPPFLEAEAKKKLVDRIREQKQKKAAEAQAAAEKAAAEKAAQEAADNPDPAVPQPEDPSDLEIPEELTDPTTPAPKAATDTPDEQPKPEDPIAPDAQDTPKPPSDPEAPLQPDEPEKPDASEDPQNDNAPPAEDPGAGPQIEQSRLSQP